jgi:fucose permease
MAKYGSRKVTLSFACVVVFGLLLVALAPAVPVAAVALFVFGGVVGAMDVAMNANAVVVERKMARAIMSSSHAFWSIGGFVGGGAGGFIIQAYGHLFHAGLVSVVAAVVLAAAARHVLADEPQAAHATPKFSLPRSPTVYLIGLIALLCMVPEGAVLDWAALYLRQDHGTSLAVASFAFACYAGAMAISRFMGDRIRDRFGAVRTLRISALISAGGLFVAGIAPWPWLVILAFAITGFAIANTVPIAFSAGGNQPGIASSTGMSVVTTMGYSGILLAPSPIGFVAEHAGFSPIFIGLSVCLVVVAMVAGLVHAADYDHKQ